MARVEPRAYTIDPEVAHERARKARAAQLSLDYHVRKVVDRASELTPEQREMLRPAAAPVGGAAE
ncbi:hypothetical protein [Streptomyces sp. NPDC001978]|uniref:hypothetical protein n=1 Tax=Streptomyces sp. NPDC001978 TaxID=3364627 RepID=UPI00368A44BE